MRVTETLKALLDASDDIPLPVLLDRLVAALPDTPATRKRITTLVDESRAAWQWLLGVRHDGHLLLLSNGLSATPLALTRVWTRVTVFGTSAEARRLLTRRTEDAGLDNIVILDGSDENRLPFADHAFDAVCWTAVAGQAVPCASPDAMYDLSPLITEAKRILAPNGQFCLQFPNRWHRGQFSKAVEPPRFRPGSVDLTLRGAGLSIHASFAHEYTDESERSFVDLDSRSAIETYRAGHPGRLRYLPNWLYRATPPEIIVMAGTGPTRAPWLSHALDAVREHLGLKGNDWHASTPVVNLKSKLTVILSQGTHPEWIVKIPLNSQCQAGVENSDRVMQSLSQSLTPDDMLAGLLPDDTARLEFEGKPLFVESICRGRPWAADGPDHPRVLDTDLLSVLTRLMETEDPLLADTMVEPADKIEPLITLLDTHAPELSDVMRRVGERLTESARGRPARLRKGDMTLSNIFLVNRRVSGLIDWDETEVSPFPLAAYGDLLFSWLWQCEGMRRSESLAILVGGNLDRMPPSLAVPDTLARLGVNADELALAALVSWVDHAHHELKHPIFRYRRDRVKSLLIGPCRSLAELWEA